MITFIELKTQCASMRFNALLAFLFCFSFTIHSQDCGNNFDLQKLKRENPARYQEFLRIEKITEAYRAKLAGSAGQRLIDQNGIITVPVVFHVLFSPADAIIGTGTNISVARLNE